MPDTIRLVRPDDRLPGALTPGMDREEAVATEGLWAGFVRTAPGTASGWHHHAGHESVIYALAGLLRMEFGPGGKDVVEAGPGDFVFIPPHAVHREVNPTAEENRFVVFRSGTGPVVINVDGPETPAG